MEFSTQRELLEYLGKNPNDRSLVQRMMIRGEIFKENGMYYLVNKDEKIAELKNLVEKLRSEITTMKENNWDLNYAKAQWEHYQGLYESEKLDKEYRLEKAFQWIKGHIKWVSWDEFHEWVMDDEQD